MSSISDRPPLNGIVKQGLKSVGSVVIPGMDGNSDEVDAFVEQFNDCYGPLKMRVLMNEDPRPVSKERNESMAVVSWYQKYFSGSLTK